MSLLEKLKKHIEEVGEEKVKSDLQEIAKKYENAEKIDCVCYEVFGHCVGMGACTEEDFNKKMSKKNESIS